MMCVSDMYEKLAIKLATVQHLFHLFFPLSYNWFHFQQLVKGFFGTHGAHGFHRNFTRNSVKFSRPVIVIYCVLLEVTVDASEHLLKIADAVSCNT